MFTIIAAVDSKNGIGKDGGIPWKCPEDLKHFRQTTTGNIVIMGRVTYESIGKPLLNRINCIISRTMEQPDDDDTVKVFNDPWDCVRWCQKNHKTTIVIDGKDVKTTREIFVCGGEAIYKWFYNNGLVAHAVLTNIVGDYDCDKKLPITLVPTSITHESYIRGPIYGVEPNADCTKDCDHCTRVCPIYRYRIVNVEEWRILSLMKEILTIGNARGDRTGTGTLSLFGKHLEFDLTDNKFPLMTSRRTFLRGLFEEIMFYLRGQTDSKILEAKGVNVWKGNTTREFLDSRGLQHYEVGDMGHTYGFSYRHKGADYKGCNVDYTGQGFDQLTNLIDGIKSNPEGRRHIIDLWEPEHMHKAALPPCLYGFQFYVADGMISCQMKQRSSDIMTAGGWNVATGALLTIMIASVCGLEPNKLVWDLGDVHIYNNLIAGAKEQVTRTPPIYPKLFLKDAPDDITKFEYANLELINYNPLPKGSIKIVMNV